jgi:hypothetical protein
MSGEFGDIQGSTSWSVDSSYGSSLSFKNVGDYASLKLQLQIGIVVRTALVSGLRGMKRALVGPSEQISNVMLSLGNEQNSSLQIGTNGSSIEVFLNTFGKRTRVSLPASVQDNTWHCLTLTYDSTDSNELSFYLDGSLIGRSSVFSGGLDFGSSEKWLVGLAELSSPSSGRFIGNIDDLRLYDKILNLSDHLIIFNSGMGDLNLVASMSYPDTTESNPIVLDLNFSRYGVPCEVDFNKTIFESGLKNAFVITDPSSMSGSSFSY